MPMTPSVLVVSFLLAGGASTAGPVQAEPSSSAGLSATARAVVEPVYRNANGYGFSSFSCDLRRASRPGDHFDCDAVDEKSASLRYTFTVDEPAGASIVQVSFPASRLDADQRAQLEPPCRAFLDAYGRSSWKSLYEALHPALRGKMTFAELREQVENARNVLGKLRLATVETVTVRASADPQIRHTELVWALDSEGGPGIARFRVGLEGEVPRVTAFRIYPVPGTPLQSIALGAALRNMVSGLLGEPVTRIAAPLEKLENVGDTVLGTAVLASGRDAPVRVEQSGRTDDFELNDFKCQVLDAPWLIRKSFASRSLELASVDCPSRVVPDDRSQVCDAVLKTGERYAVTIHRRGGEHSITASGAPDR